MKRGLLVLLIGLGSFLSLLACAETTTTPSTTETTDTTEPWLTGTYFLWVSRVLQAFEDVDFSAYAFVEARHFPDPENPTQYVVVDVDGLAVEAEVAGMFAHIGTGSMFPSKNTLFAEYDLRFVNGTAEIVVTLSELSTEVWAVSFLLFSDGTEEESFQLFRDEFPDEFDALFFLLEGLGSL